MEDSGAYPQGGADEFAWRARRGSQNPSKNSSEGGATLTSQEPNQAPPSNRTTLDSSNVPIDKLVHGDDCNFLHAFHEHLHGIFGAFKHGILVGKACEFAQETKHLKTRTCDQDQARPSI